MKNYDAYIFDFDYTLADASKGIVMCFHHVLRRHGYHDITDVNIKDTIGQTLEDSFAILTGVTDTETIVSYRDQYEKKADDCMTVNTGLFPETSNVLYKLKSRGAKLGIVSNKYRYRIMELIDKEFPRDFFDVVIGGEDVTAHKPAPDGLLLAIGHMKSDLNKCLYIGDSTVDAMTAQAAKVDFYGVLQGTTSRSELIEYPHLGIANNLTNLIE